MATVRILLDVLTSFAALVVLVASVVVALSLWKRKQGGAAGGVVLALARTGVFLASFGFLLVTPAVYELNAAFGAWLSVGLRGVILLSTLLTGVAFLLIKTSPKQAPSQGDGHD